MKKVLSKIVKVLKKLIIPLIIIIIFAGGFIYWQKYTEEKKRKLAEEEKRRQEEIQKEKERQLLEKKKKEYLALIEEMRKFFKEGNYKKVKELAEKALSLAKEFNFDTGEINKILHQVKVAKYMKRLKELQQANENIFNYFYVRREIIKIPSWNDLIKLKKKIYNKTFENEYVAMLSMSEKYAKDGKEGKEPILNYFLSKDYLYQAKRLREMRNISPDLKREKEIADIEKDTFFAWKKFKENTIPSSLY